MQISKCLSITYLTAQLDCRYGFTFIKLAPFSLCYHFGNTAYTLLGQFISVLELSSVCTLEGLHTDVYQMCMQHLLLSKVGCWVLLHTLFNAYIEAGYCTVIIGAVCTNYTLWVFSWHKIQRNNKTQFVFHIRLDLISRSSCTPWKILHSMCLHCHKVHYNCIMTPTICQSFICIIVMKHIIQGYNKGNQATCIYTHMVHLVQ